MDDVHTFTAISRQGKAISIVTGCGQEMVVKPADGERLEDHGITAWHSRTTCTPCLDRSKVTS